MSQRFPVQTSADRRTAVHQPPALENGDRLDQRTFHERYEAMPHDVRAELIGGIVFMASPQKLPHGRHQKLVVRWLEEYEEATLGVESLAGVTDILDMDSEPEPDCCLLIKRGGQTRETADEYLAGPPELVVEIASGTESIDLHRKKDAYEKGGVREYVVVALRKKKVFWFVRRRGKYREATPDAHGVYRSEGFPGLWLDSAALLERDRSRLLRVLRQGLATSEHKSFMAKLARMA